MGETKRILILTADTGFGHRSAANAVADALRERRAGDVAVEIVNPMNHRRVPLLLRRSQQDYDRVVRQAPRLYKLGYEASGARVPGTIVESALTVLLYEAMREIVARHQPDVIISTYPVYAYPLVALFAVRRQAVPLLVVITDLASVHRVWFHKSVDLCLVPTPAVCDLALEAGLAPRQVRITGIPVSPKLSDDERTPAAIRSELGWQPDRTAVLAVGSRRVGQMTGVLHALNHSGLPIQLAAVAGGDADLYQQLQHTEWHVPTHVYNFVEDMPSLIRAADCIVSKAGGLIVTEALACGRPLLLVDALPGQEEGNAAYVVEGGAGELARAPIEALEILYHWMERGGELLGRRSEHARALGRPHAAYEVADLAWQAAVPRPQKKRRRLIPSRTKIVALLGRHGVAWKEPAKDEPSSQAKTASRSGSG
ncbi:MAG: MGDG synthase family glycosyltransferase [Anaerolineales bacterium]